jgi:molybdate transport system substrate-binding protein
VAPATVGASPSPAGQTQAPAPALEITVYAAASLKDVLADIQAAYAEAEPGVALTVARDSSATLRAQIEQGAPADVFLSADAKNPEALVDAGLADGAPVTFAGNLLTVIVPADNPAGVHSPRDLARPGLKVIAAGDEVPISNYAAEALDKLALEPGYPADYVAAYAANVVSKEVNVKAVVAKIEVGEGDAAIVYVTDATASGSVATIEIPADANVPAKYSGVVVGGSAHSAGAHAFLEWLRGPEATPIFAKFGFLPPT